MPTTCTAPAIRCTWSAKLGYNIGAIDVMARIVSEYLESLNLRDVIVIAHSKGGLIAKQALAKPDTVHRVRHVIAINTPFSGSRYANLFLMPSVRMFMPTGLIITQLALNNAINSHISSLYSVFDPHIPETSHLEGARERHSSGHRSLPAYRRPENPGDDRRHPGPLGR